MIDTDDRPSIAELRSLIESDDRIDEFESTCRRMQCQRSLIFRVCHHARAAPVLLEIVAAALAMRETEDALADAECDFDLYSERACAALHEFHLALAKVRP